MENIKDKFIEYKRSKNFLDTLCKAYFEANHNINWEHYSHWTIDDKCEMVYLHYSYEEFWSNTEMYTEVGTTIVSIDELIEFGKTLWER